MLNPDESSLVGRWLAHGTGLVADETCHRIQALTAGHLVQIAKSPDGWSKLYRDPTDNRLWEEHYPQSHVQGGGPPALQCISSQAASAKFGAKV